MKHIPMLFSTDMVRAILDGRKTQTRRVVKPQPANNGKPIKIWAGWPALAPCGVKNNVVTCPYGKVGDVIWVRETWSHLIKWSLMRGEEKGYAYKATDEDVESLDGGKWKPSIHMPKAAARIWLQITNIRVERLRDISTEDVEKEGVMFHFSDARNEKRYRDYDWEYNGDNYVTTANAQQSYFSLWNEINGRDSHKANPWVWVVSFKVLSTTGYVQSE